MSNKTTRTKIEQEQKSPIVNDQKARLLEKILSFASKQTLLPKFLQLLDHKCANTKKKRLQQHKKTVKKIYSEKTKFLLQYNPDEALTAQQKLQIKIQKIQNNQLQIEYFDKVKSKEGKYLPLFKGAPLQKVSYPTKREFQMFSEFNEKKFIKSYSHLFDDQLELKEPSLLRKQRVNTIPVLPQHPHQNSDHSIANPKFNKFKIEQLRSKQTERKKPKKVRLRPLTEAVEPQIQWSAVVEKPINQKYKPHIQKTIIGKMIKDSSRSLLYEKMLKIGSYPSSVSQTAISLTKQSLGKHLKLLYERQGRIMDFLEIRPTLSLAQYESLCTKLKLMSVEHIVFMTFLLYDFNNDGYICDHDIRKLKALVKEKKNQVIQEDLKIIQAIKQRKQYKFKILLQKNTFEQGEINEQQMQDDCNYLELYKLPQITESTYFLWLNKNKQIKSNREMALSSEDLQVEKPEKLQVGGQKRKKITNPFNPSVLKYKYNFSEQKAEVRKYIFSIKAKKTYISFNQFRNKYLQNGQSKKVINTGESRTIQNSRLRRDITKNSSILNSVKYKQSQSQVKIQPKIRYRKEKSFQKLFKPFLWYDLMEKLAGVKYQGLNYE